MVQETSGIKRSLGKRETDIMFTTRSSPTNSELNSSPSNRSTERHAHRSAKKPAYAVAEITSSNYHNDIFSKWRDYFQVGILFYFIFHLHEKSSSKKSYITVGSYNRKTGYETSAHGHFKEMASSSTRSAADRRRYYYKKVFSNDEIINVGPYEGLGFTAEQMLSVSFMTEQVRKKREQFKQLSRLNANQAQEILNLTAQNSKLTAQNDFVLERVRQLEQEAGITTGNNSRTQSSETRDDEANGRPNLSRSTGRTNGRS